MWNKLSNLPEMYSFDDMTMGSGLLLVWGPECGYRFGKCVHSRATGRSRWEEDGGVLGNKIDFTHWSPLPEPPEEDEE